MQEHARSKPERAYKLRTTGYVYFIRCGERAYQNRIATEPEARLANHQVSNAQKLVLLGAYPGTLADEKALHQRFASTRVRGEWFTASRELRREIDRGRNWWVDHRIARNLAETADLLACIRGEAKR